MNLLCALARERALLGFRRGDPHRHHEPVTQLAVGLDEEREDVLLRRLFVDLGPRLPLYGVGLASGAESRVRCPTQALIVVRYTSMPVTINGDGVPRGPVSVFDRLLAALQRAWRALRDRLHPILGHRNGKPTYGQSQQDVGDLKDVKLQLEVAKLRCELRRYSWPGWWEFTKTAITWVGIIAGLVTLILSLQKAEREALSSAADDFAANRPEYGALLLTSYGERAVPHLVDGILGAPHDELGRRRSLAAIGALRVLKAESSSGEKLFSSMQKKSLASERGKAAAHCIDRSNDNAEGGMPAQVLQEMRYSVEVIEGLTGLLGQEDEESKGAVERCKTILNS